MNHLVENLVESQSKHCGKSAQRKRVLVLIKGLGLGGAEKLLAGSIPHWNRDEFEYEVGYLLPWKDALVPEFEQAEVKVTCFEAGSTVDFKAFHRVGKYIQREKFDLVHTHLPIAGLVGRIAAHWHGVKGIVYTEHGSWVRLNRFTKWATRLTMGLNDLTIAVSEDVAESISKRNRRNIQTITNGIDCLSFTSPGEKSCLIREELGISPHDFVIGKVANLLLVKRHETLIRAFALFHRKTPESHLVLIGQLRGRDEYLRKIAKEEGVADNVIFTGPRSDVHNILQALDLFAMSSLSEGLPVSLLEAMACSLPVVCTDVGGIPGVVTDKKQGFLVPVDDAELMARRFTQLAESSNLRQQMGAAGREHVCEHYDISRMVEQVEQAYRNILEKNS